MIDYSFEETNTEIVLTFTGDTNEILRQMAGEGHKIDMSDPLNEDHLDGLYRLVDKPYLHYDRHEEKWLRVVVETPEITFTFTSTEIEDYPFLIVS